MPMVSSAAPLTITICLVVADSASVKILVFHLIMQANKCSPGPDNGRTHHTMDYSTLWNVHTAQHVL